MRKENASAGGSLVDLTTTISKLQMKFVPPFTLPVCMSLVFLLSSIAGINSDGLGDDRNVLSRRKRYVAFPEGSTLIFAFCVTTQTILPFRIFTEGVNWGMAYDLPNATTYMESKKYFLQRRQRRDLYDRFETIINSFGHDGRSCIYRALCEAPRRLIPKENTLSEDILRLLFKFPQKELTHDEPEDHRLYHWAYRRGRENMQQECHEMFPTCSISLIDLALGYYNDYT